MDKSLFLRGIEEILPSKDSFLNKIESEKITIYLGIDPTSPNIHIGNAVALWKLRMLQDEGHKVILLFGDFTATLGDPSERLETRKRLTKEEVLKNSETYADQAGKILNFSGDNPTVIKFNSEWLEDINLEKIIDLASNFTIQQLLQRRFVQDRLVDETPIGLHEFLYPILQGYDSVRLKVDAEIGGSDQTFNMLAGRTLLKKEENKDKFVISVNLLPGLDGRKMSKSFENTINVSDNPEEMYQKVMRIDDQLVKLYFDLATKLTIDEIEGIIKGENLASKKRLALEITQLYWGEEKANQAAERFCSVVQQQDPTKAMSMIQSYSANSGATIAQILVDSQMVPSSSEAKRLITQGGVAGTADFVHFEKITEPTFIPEKNFILKKGAFDYKKIEVAPSAENIKASENVSVKKDENN